jgi:hypothetical protein
MSEIEVRLQDLMAPTWVERSRTDDRLFFGLSAPEEDMSRWPEAVLREVGELKPSSVEFLSALVAFWAEVALQQYNDRMSSKKEKLDATLASRLASPHACGFPMTPAVPPLSESMLRGSGAWKLISRLGPYAVLVEKQLLACIEHPLSTIHDAAARAFGTADAVCDEVYRALLAHADHWGTGGFVRLRASALAKHMSEARLTLVLAGIVPGLTGQKPGDPERRFEARCAILERLKREYAATALRHVLDHLDDGWSDEHLAKLVYALVRLGQEVGMPEEAVPRMLALANHANNDVRTEAVWFLANHSPQAYHALLLEKLHDPYPRVLDAICNGITLHDDVPPDLLRRAAARTLGNYDGHDGEPHDSAVAMLTASASHARTALPEIIAWWEQASSSAWLNQNEIRQALDIAALLDAQAAPLKAGLQRALAWLTRPYEDEAELPVLGEPGAIAVIQQKLEEGMREAGNPPEVVEAAGEFYGGLLSYIADSTEGWQQEIDERQARRDAERRELYPEWYAEGSAAEPGKEEEADFEPEAYEDELVTELRAVIGRL